MSAATKSCCKCKVQLKFYLEVYDHVPSQESDSSHLWLPLSDLFSLASVPLTFNLETILPTVAHRSFNAFGILLYLFPCLYRAIISSLNSLKSCFDLVIYLTCNQRSPLANPSLVQVFLCVLSHAHLMQLKKSLIRSVRCA